MKWTDRAKRRFSRNDYEKSLSVAMAMGTICFLFFYDVLFCLFSIRTAMISVLCSIDILFVIYRWYWFSSSFVLISLCVCGQINWSSELSKETNILLQFRNKELETSYVKQRESMSSVPLIASVLIHVVASVYSSLILPSSFVHFLVVIAPIILTLPTVYVSVAESFPMVCWPASASVCEMCVFVI